MIAFAAPLFIYLICLQNIIQWLRSLYYLFLIAVT